MSLKASLLHVSLGISRLGSCERKVVVVTCLRLPKRSIAVVEGWCGWIAEKASQLLSLLRRASLDAVLF